jgi:hypothetical protein
MDNVGGKGGQNAFYVISRLEPKVFVDFSVHFLGCQSHDRILI